MPTTDDSGIVYLTAEDVWQIHLALADDFARAGVPFEVGLVDPNGLEAAANQPRQTFDGADLYPDLFAKAAALARGIIRGHVFLDANKRTGMESAILFLEYNGWEVYLSRDEYVTLALDIAGDKRSGKEPIEMEEIARRLAAAAVRTESP